MVLEITDNGLYSILTSLPSWMILTVIMSTIFSPLIMELIRQSKKKKEDVLLSSFLQEMRNSTVENQSFVHSFKNYLEELYAKLDVLLDLLYEKYANNLSPEISKKIIELVYERTNLRTLTFLADFFSDEHKYDNGKFRVCTIENELRLMLRNRYYADLMTLNKMTCKGITLDLHLSTVDVDLVTQEIITFLNANKGQSGWDLYGLSKRYLEGYFQTLSNKAQSKLEDKLKDKI